MSATAENARITVLGQRRNMALLTAAIQKGSVAHAYLVVGAPGSGKKTLAFYLAQLLFCEEAVGERADAASQPCGACHSCRRVANGNHPDVRLVAPEGVSFKIDQVREVQGEASLSPYEADTKVFILESAELMTEEAQNSLLKTLEEPPPHSVFVLLAPEATALLPTIVSRCQLVRMEPLSEKDICAELERRGVASDVEARTAAALSGGCLGRARAVLGEPLRQTRDKAVSFVESVGVLGAGECLRLAAEFEKDREGADFFAQMLSLLYRDLAVLAAADARDGDEPGLDGQRIAAIAAMETLLNRDVATMLGREARYYDVAGCLAAEAALTAFAEMARLNLNTRLLLDVLLLELRELRRGGRFTAAWDELLERVTA